MSENKKKFNETLTGLFKNAKGNLISGYLDDKRLADFKKAAATVKPGDKIMIRLRKEPDNGFGENDVVAFVEVVPAEFLAQSRKTDGATNAKRDSDLNF